ncbi:MAG: hypothetical protein ABUL54_05820, partial [Dongia sp.]
MGRAARSETGLMGFKFRSRFDRSDETGEKKPEGAETDTPLARLRSGLGLQSVAPREAAAAAEAERREPPQLGRDQAIRMAAPAIPDLPPDPPLRASQRAEASASVAQN